MVAQLTDNFIDPGDGQTKTTLQTPGKEMGGTSMKLASSVGWPTESLAIISMRRIDLSTGEPVAGTYTEWTGIVNGSDIDNLELKLGNDQSYPPGEETEVYITISVTWARRLIVGLLKTMSRAGELKDAVVKTVHLDDKAVTLPKINGGSTAGILITDSNGVTSVDEDELVAFYGVTNGSSNSITVVAPFDGVIEVDFSMLTWGMAGSLYTAQLSAPSGLTAVVRTIGGVQGGDTVNKPLAVKGLYTGAVKGQSYIFTLTNVASAPGVTNNRCFAVKVFKQKVA